MSITSSALKTPGRCWGWCIRNNRNRLVREIPNSLTLIRVFAPVVGFLSYQSYVNRHTYQAVVWLAALGGLMLTDWLDGKAARSLRVESDFGKLVDPIMDKALAFTMLALFWLGLYAHHRHPDSLLAVTTGAVIAIRLLLDAALLMIGGAGGALKKLGFGFGGQDIELGANRWGKWKFRFDCTAIVVGFLALYWAGSGRLVAAPIAFDVLLAPACVFAVMSLTKHLQDALRPSASRA